ncbi:peroxisome proliferator-activated receptor gamma coactivator 1-alpha-like [Peromyscus eremicus]|uniref:peroxisome proliferator-activated receptor gamma coactivator 1-alpha-like n=1 Tax=Peromyscus eremicus TaxID=42410 RepID=UPI0027DDF495|nr:peroxisome proliferator-activated receptor gamma coactivator 1-alpha-like [Peromyscus eremicus]
MAWDMCSQDSVWSDIECAALVGEDQPLCPDLPELDLSELDVNDLDTDSFLGGLKWCSDQSEIISNQYNNEPANIFEVSISSGEFNFSSTLAWAKPTRCHAWTHRCSYIVASRQFVIAAREFLCYGNTMLVTLWKTVLFRMKALRPDSRVC